MAWASIDPATDPPSLAIGAAKAEHNLCLQIPGCNKGKDDIWRVPLTWPAYVAFRAVWSVQPITVLPPLLAWEHAKWAEISQRREMRMALDAPEPLARQMTAMEDGGELHLDAIQRGHVAWLAQWRRCILGDPMGNGKTPPLIRALQVVPGALPALVICPDSAPLAWKRKINDWAPELTTIVVAGTALARRRALDRARELAEACPVHGPRIGPPTGTPMSGGFTSQTPHTETGRAGQRKWHGQVHPSSSEEPGTEPHTSATPSESPPSSTTPCSPGREGTARSAQPPDDWPSTMTGGAAQASDHAGSASGGSYAPRATSPLQGQVSYLDGHTLLGSTCHCPVVIIVWQNLRYHTRLAAYPSQRFVCCDEHGGTTGKTAAQCEVHEKELNFIRFGTVIADECHRMADARSKQTRAAQWLAHRAENFWGVTGTLTTDEIGSLWPVLHAVEPKGWPAKGRYMDLYAQQAFAWGNGKAYAGLRPDTQQYFHLAVDPVFRRIPVRSGRPERAEPEFRYPEMTPAQRKAYRQLAKELLTDLPAGHQVVPDNHAVKFGRLVQLASSMIEVTEGEDGLGFTDERVKLCLPSNKADDLLAFLGDNEGQWIVSCFSPDLVELAARKLDGAKIAHVRIVGGMGMDAKDQAAQLFQNNPDVRVIFLTAAGGESIDLQAARGIVFLQPEPSFTLREQKIGRADRRGQQWPCRTVYMISPGTVDQRLYELGCEKEERHSEVVQDAEAMRWVLAAGAGELATDAG